MATLQGPARAGPRAAEFHPVVGPARAGRPRVLILSASVGTGHLRAAEAVAMALRQLAPDAEVRSLDAFSLATPLFRLLYADAYRVDLRRWPAFVGLTLHQVVRPG